MVFRQALLQRAELVVMVVWAVRSWTRSSAQDPWSTVVKLYHDMTN